MMDDLLRWRRQTRQAGPLLSENGTFDGASHITRIGLPQKEFTMNKTKTILFAGIAALSVGIGSAMAQTETPVTGSDTWSNPTTIQSSGTTVQSGSSDVATPAYGASSVAPFNGDYTTLANPG
jgi:hypothetical protein